MKVEIWSDVICPWCYIGKRRLETALGRFEHRDEVEVLWRSFELDPDAPARREGSIEEHLARKYGMDRMQAKAANTRLTSLAAAEGLEYHLEAARPGNTFAAHRLLHLAAERGLQQAVQERLFRGYFTEGAAVGDPETLVHLAAEAGLDPAEARTVLEGDAYSEEVRADEQLAVDLGCEGVPFFVIDRAFGVSGAQPADLLLQALHQAWAAQEPDAAGRDPGAAGGERCTDGDCTV